MDFLPVPSHARQWVVRWPWQLGHNVLSGMLASKPLHDHKNGFQMRRFDLNHSPQMRHKRLTKDEARPIAANIAQLPETPPAPRNVNGHGDGHIICLPPTTLIS